MKQVILCIVCLLVGAGAGVGGWMVYTNPRMLESEQEIADLKAQVEGAQTRAEADKKASDSQIARLQSDLKQSRTQTTFAATQLRKMQSELKLMQLELTQLKAPPVEETATELVPVKPISATTATASTTKPATAAKTPAPAGVRQYTVQNGDSFWKIAANELDNGARYTEIIKLNPGMTEKSKLDVGQIINIPAE